VPLPTGHKAGGDLAAAILKHDIGDQPLKPTWAPLAIAKTLN
jgi:hypothetical protein